MDTLGFDKLLLQSAFCCMASDGNIDKREIAHIRSMCERSRLFEGFNFQEEINTLVDNINKTGKKFISNYFDLLDKSDLSENEEITLIDFAIQTIKADDQIKYSEIKFFKNIRHRLKVSDDKLLAVFPETQLFLEEDIITESYLEKVTSNYLENLEFPKFDFISIDTGSIADFKNKG